MSETVDINALRKLVGSLEADLKEQLAEHPEREAALKLAWEDATTHERTGLEFIEWSEEYITQVAVAWVLAVMFARYLEDHGFIEPTLVGQLAEDRQRDYFRDPERRVHTDTDYLLELFRRLAKPPAGELFRPERNPLHKMRLSGDGARTLLAFFREVDPDTGALRFKFKGMDTRFLGDVYQDLSEAVRKKYALLQTPDFVEEFILDLTLDPAIDEFGLDEVRFIDPTCGSGHFLLGGFKRLYERKYIERGSTERKDVLVREALEATYGVDINPFAVSIARFRLLVEAFSLCGITRWDTQTAFPLNVGVGDSLILGRHFPRFETRTTAFQHNELDPHRWNDDIYSTEDNDLLFGEGEKAGFLMQQYHAVVGNPPYITVKDPKLREVYKRHYTSCSGKYSLVCPFFERFFELAIGPTLNAEQDQMKLGGEFRKIAPGFVCMIASNAFMKRSYGKKLVEEIMPNVDLTHVIDTSGAYIPGHGTPTVILAGRNQRPKSGMLRAVLGIRGEPSTPTIPSQGKVWNSIKSHTYNQNFENNFVTITEFDRKNLEQHPLSTQGGGALECKKIIEKKTRPMIEEKPIVGISSVNGEDGVFILESKQHAIRINIPTKRLITGDVVRNWKIKKTNVAIWVYDAKYNPIEIDTHEHMARYFWPTMNFINRRKRFGTPMIDKNLKWYEWQELYHNRLTTPLTITFAEVATHNHFVLDRGDKVFKQTAPIIKLPANATVENYLELLGALNSSSACFWMKQVTFNKGYSADKKGARIRSEPDEDFYAYDSTKTKLVPIPDVRPLELARQLDELGQRSTELEPSTLAESATPTPALLDEARDEQEEVFERMVALQEELDWRCYELYGLLDEGEAPLATEEQREQMPGVQLGERAFEIVMARKIEEGDLVTSWFERHNSTPITQIPAHWPAWYQQLVERRIKLIEERRFIRLIEQPKYKRRWNRDAWADRETKALRSWLLDRLESPAYVPQADREDARAEQDPRVVTVRELAEVAQDDADWMVVAERFTGDPSFDVEALVGELLSKECVPFLPSQRYKPSGLTRRKTWETVWEMQRAEDAIDARCALPEDDPDFLTEEQAEALKKSEVGAIPKPPSYRQSDFQSAQTYKLRGKLDVPKERFIALEGCALDGHSPPLMWAGFDHRQQALALLRYYQRVKTTQGWGPGRLVLLLAGLKDQLPWLKQWHNELDPRTRTRFGDFVEGFVDKEARALDGLSLDAVEKARL